MRRTFIKIVALILCFAFCFSSFGCSSCNDSEQVVNQNHQQTITETNDWLVKGAQSEYKIVIAKDASSEIITASRELQTLFKEATGIVLPILTDDAVTYDKTSKFLSIGNNKLCTAVGLTASTAQLKNQGFYIRTIDKSVFMLGATDRGSLYAVYEYLYHEFNFDHYFTDLYYIDKNVTDKKLNNYDVKEVPDIDQMTVPNVGYMQYNTINANRFRVIQVSDWSIPQNNYNNVHNIFYILPPSEFLEEHRAWYSSPDDIDNSQVCFSAHSTREEIEGKTSPEYEAMIQEFLNVIQKGIKNTDAEIFSISQRDNRGFCNCDNCNEISRYYGAKSSLLILLCNRLSEEMELWFENEGAEYKRDLKILFLAYQDVESAPAVYNAETQKYEPTNPKMKCRENVGVYIASLSIYNTYDFEHEVNKTVKENIIAWRSLTDKFAFWTYDVNFQCYFMPYDSWHIRQDLYKLLAESGTMVLNDQGQTQNIGSCTAWDNLKSYLSTKLRWNTNVDLQQLTKRYFEVCYKSAADTMYQVYLQYLAHANQMKINFENGVYEGKVNQGAIGDIFGGLENPILWEKPMVTAWYELFKKALSELDSIKATDPVGYEKAYKMISAEIASPIYMLIKMYGATYSTETLDELKREFKYYCTVSGINSFKDSTATGGIENLYSQLGIE